MSDEVVNWHFNALELFQTFEGLAQQFKVESVRMVEVVVVVSCLFVLFVG